MLGPWDFNYLHPDNIVTYIYKYIQIMFTLRTISVNGVQTNKSLGNQYSFVSRYENPDSFRETFNVFFNTKHVADNDPTSDDRSKDCYGFVFDEKENIMSLWKPQKYFIMADSGKTFANLSFK